jgi:hypothetical protein
MICSSVVPGAISPEMNNPMKLDRTEGMFLWHISAQSSFFIGFIHA